jgi:hypothetical protein
MDVEVSGAERLRFEDGSPVRAASAIVRLGDGHLVVSDDATHAAWFRNGAASKVRLLPAVGGHEEFDDESGTKHLKPDLEAAVEIDAGGTPEVLVMGSGSSPRRMRWCLVRSPGERLDVVVADASAVYSRVAAALDVDPDELNLEGACVVGDALRWFHRGLPSAGLPSASVDLPLAGVVAVASGQKRDADLHVGRTTRYDLGCVDGVGLAITDVVALPSGDLLASTAAEDTPNARDDGPVRATALARLRDDEVVEVVRLPDHDGKVLKVEGLMVLDQDGAGAVLRAVTDLDDPDAASWAARLRVRF